VAAPLYSSGTPNSEALVESSVPVGKWNLTKSAITLAADGSLPASHVIEQPDYDRGGNGAASVDELPFAMLLALRAEGPGAPGATRPLQLSSPARRKSRRAMSARDTG
jgi:hypothetical protein